MYFMLLYFSSAVSSPLYSSICRLQGQFHLNRMHKAGDVVLGGIFQVHFFSVLPDLSFTLRATTAYLQWVSLSGKKQNLKL